MQHKEEKTNPYLAEAKRYGFTPEHMARSAEMVEQMLTHYDTIENVERKMGSVLAWATHADTMGSEDLKFLGVMLLAIQDYSKFQVNQTFTEVSPN